MLAKPFSQMVDEAVDPLGQRSACCADDVIE